MSVIEHTGSGIGLQEWRSLERDGWKFCNSVEVMNGYMAMIFHNESGRHSAVLLSKDESRWEEKQEAKVSVGQLTLL